MELTDIRFKGTVDHLSYDMQKCMAFYDRIYKN